MQLTLSPFRGACGLILLIFLFPHIFSAQTPPAQAGAPGPTISITVSPKIIPPMGGKLPSSTNLAVFEGDCDSTKGTSLAATVPAQNYTLMITGSGISVTHEKASKCLITANLTIDPNTPPGRKYVVLLDGTGAPVTSTDFTLMDATAGAIPPGLEPQVDVMWAVMSQNDCADVFGTRVAESLYCIQLKIGNNTGHPIQLAGIGFTNELTDLTALGVPFVTFANNSYASTRAILLHQEMWAPRNVLYHSLQGAGLIMAGFIPFFGRPNAKTNFATATSIVSGPLLQAFGIIAPDPIISQLNNLDDQSFRDNLVITNNAHIQTVVFVEKQALTLSLRDLQIRLNNAATGTAKIEYLQRVQVQSNASSPTASGVTITPSTFSVAAGSATTQQFTAAVTNDQNSAGVTWTLTGSDCQANTCGTSTNTTTTAVYTAPQAPPAPDNTVTLTATSKADTSKFGTATITITAPPAVPSAISVTGGTGQTANINTAFAKPLQANVMDNAGNPVSDAVVTFTPPASGASGTFASGANTATTNASGVATSTTFTANGTHGGPYNVTATVTGVATPAIFTLKNN
jgi:hypothetical protein